MFYVVSSRFPNCFTIPATTRIVEVDTAIHKCEEDRLNAIKNCQLFKNRVICRIERASKINV